ncbi:MAG: PepSY domain-containing protein, partial [Rhodococcus sp. (in: high G+C Gram-positive bacteria)]
MSTTDTVVPEIGPSASDPSPPPPSLVMRLHFYAGIFIAPFILIAALSGGLYALAPTAENILYSDLLRTDSTGPTTSVAEQVDAATQIRPDLTVHAVRPAAEPGDTTRVMFTDPSLGESERRAVFIDPVTAESVGESVVYGSSGALPMRTWISGFHRHLHLGEPGRIYSELAASWMWIVALGGVVLWVRRYRRGGRLLTVDRSVTGRARTRNWHGGVGIWIAVGL